MSVLNTEPFGARTEALVALGGALVLASSMPLTWLSVRAGDGQDSYPLLEAVGPAVVVALAVILIAGGALAALVGRPAGMELAGVAAVGVVLAVGGFIAATETVPAFVSFDWLPVTLRRLSASSGAGPGAWLGLLAACTVAFAGAPRARARLLAHLPGRSAMLLALLILAIVALVLLRQGSWFEASVQGESIAIEGSALPWVAPMTLAAIWLMVAGVGLALADRTVAGALILAFAGWLVNVSAAITIAASRVVLGLHAADSHGGPAAWTVFAIGLAVTGLASALLILDREELR